MTGGLATPGVWDWPGTCAPMPGLWSGLGPSTPPSLCPELAGKKQEARGGQKATASSCQSTEDKTLSRETCCTKPVGRPCPCPERCKPLASTKVRPIHTRPGCPHLTHTGSNARPRLVMPRRGMKDFERSIYGLRFPGREEAQAQPRSLWVGRTEPACGPGERRDWIPGKGPPPVGHGPSDHQGAAGLIPPAAPVCLSTDALAKALLCGSVRSAPVPGRRVGPSVLDRPHPPAPAASASR